MSIETGYSSYTHDTNLTARVDALERTQQDAEITLRNLVREAKLESKQQQQLRAVSANYVTRTAAIPDDNVRLRNLFLNEAIASNGLTAYDPIAVENNGITYGQAENGTTAIYVNDTQLSLTQLENVYRHIKMADKLPQPVAVSTDIDSRSDITEPATEAFPSITATVSPEVDVDSFVDPFEESHTITAELELILKMGSGALKFVGLK